MIFIQGFNDIRDIISPIHLGEFDPSLKPTVYFRRMGQFTLYAVFHRWDWSSLPWPIKKLDEHLYDFEGVLVGPEWSASVYHREIKFADYKAKMVYIQPEGHGIEFKPNYNGNWIYCGKYKLIDMDESRVNRWLHDVIQPVFNENKVHMPWQWANGLMWNDPEGLRRQ